MRILNLQLRAYGCFTNITLDFSQNGQNFHLIYGDNEAGKSTALRALTGLFYGIPSQTTDSFLHENNQLRIGAELQKTNGTKKVFVRRKGNKDTLLDKDEEAIPDAEITPYLSGIPRGVFETLFCISHDVLVQGGKDLLLGRGDVSESLFQAGTGVTGLRNILDGLQTEAEKIFKPRASTSVINAAIAGFNQARKECKEASILPRDWTRVVRELDEKKGQLQGIEKQLQQLRSEYERKQRFKLAIPHVVRRNGLIDESNKLGEVILLPESASTEREGAEHRRDNARQRKQETEGTITRLESELENLIVPEELLSQEESISSLHQRLAEYNNAERDIPKVAAEKEQLEEEAKSIIAEIKPGLSLSQADSLRLTVIQRNLIQKLSGDFSASEERLRASKEKVEDTTHDLADNNKAIGECPETPDSTKLEQRIEQVSKEGALEARLREERERLQMLEQQADAALKKLGLWSGRLDDIDVFPLPLIETVNRFETDLSDLSNEENKINTATEEARRKVTEQDKAIHVLQLGGDVPTEDTLLTVREYRDHGWRLVRRAWIEGMHDEEQERQFNPTKPLSEAYEESVDKADSVADRLRREADRVAQLASLRAEKDTAQDLCTQLEKQIESLQIKQQSIQVNWEQVWQPSGICPLPPREMREWLIRHKELATMVGAVRERRAVTAAIELSIEQNAKELSEALVATGGEPRKNGETLKSLLQNSRARLKLLVEQSKKRSDLLSDARRLAKDQNKAIREMQTAEQQLSEWQTRWAEAVRPLGFDSNLPPADAVIVLDRIQKLLEIVKSTRDKSTRLTSMQASIDQFKASIFSLVRSAAIDLKDLPPNHAAATLNKRLQTAQQHRARYQELSKQLEDEKNKLTNCNTEIDSATEKLNGLIKHAKCNDLESLKLAEERSMRKRAINKALEELNMTLSDYASGTSVENLVEELSQVNRDQLPTEIESIGEHIKDKEKQRDSLLQDKTTLENSLRTMDGSDQATAAAEQAQSFLAQIHSGTERYIQVRLACEVLRRQMERYREQNQGPIITEASRIFPRLTLNSFSGLKTGFDDKDNQILLGVRPSGDEVTVEGMSDGTRDQLYLALRLSSLHTNLNGSEPFPFIVDDVLINFDDDRSGATLKVLAELSNTTQVLFFTHHSRLEELAQKFVARDQLRTHRLTKN